LNQVYEIRFELADLKQDNRELKRMIRQLVRQKLNTTDGIQEANPEEEFEDSEVDIYDSFHLSKRSSLRKIVEARKRRKSLLQIS